MKTTTGLASGWMCFAIAATLAWFSASPTAVQAQGAQGQDAVYNSLNTVVGSYAFIDASMFATSPPPPSRNLCGVLNFVLQNVDIPPHYPSGAVIDARGLNSTNTSMTCTISPWAGITNPPPSTILLPATGALPPNASNPIIIPTPWILPPNTHLIGEGDGIPIFSTTGSLISAPGTTIQAKNGFTTPA